MLREKKDLQCKHLCAMMEYIDRLIPHHSPPASFPQSEKAAPIIGPIKKPREKATPIMAMPLPLVEGVETSVTIAVDRETFPAS